MAAPLGHAATAGDSALPPPPPTVVAASVPFLTRVTPSSVPPPRALIHAYGGPGIEPGQFGGGVHGAHCADAAHATHASAAPRRAERTLGRTMRAPREQDGQMGEDMQLALTDSTEETAGRAAARSVRAECIRGKACRRGAQSLAARRAPAAFGARAAACALAHALLTTP